MNLPYTLEKVVPGSASHVYNGCCMLLLSGPSGPGWWKLLCHLHCAGPFASIQMDPAMDPHGNFNKISDKNLVE